MTKCIVKHRNLTAVSLRLKLPNGRLPPHAASSSASKDSAATAIGRGGAEIVDGMSSTHSVSPASAACRAIAWRLFSSSAAIAAAIASRSDCGVAGLLGCLESRGRLDECELSSTSDEFSSLAAEEAAARCINYGRNQLCNWVRWATIAYFHG